MGFDGGECAGLACCVCFDGLKRCCGMSAVGVQWLWYWVRGEVDCV